MRSKRLKATFRKELNGRDITIEVPGDFTLTRYEKNLIRFWLNSASKPYYKLPTIVPVSKRFCLDFIGWDNPDFYDVLLIKYNKNRFNELVIKTL